MNRDYANRDYANRDYANRDYANRDSASLKKGLAWHHPTVIDQLPASIGCHGARLVKYGACQFGTDEGVENRFANLTRSAAYAFFFTMGQ